MSRDFINFINRKGILFLVAGMLMFFMGMLLFLLQHAGVVSAQTAATTQWDETWEAVEVSYTTAQGSYWWGTCRPIMWTTGKRVRLRQQG